jgi:hypothetical protein
VTSPHPHVAARDARANGWWSHAHPHGHPDHARSDDPEVRRLAHPDTYPHAHEHTWDDPEDHHHPIGGE